ncbi:MAG: hypothetical protein KKC21_03815 [Nitrospinae bacterium]|nr:hypothetical protein [Nitrospinota bacterium]
MRLKCYPLAAAALFISFLFIGPSPLRAGGISVDAAKGTVTVNAFINHRYFRNPNLCLLVHRKGYNAKRALFIAEAEPAELYDALVSLGLKPGGNLSTTSQAGRKTEGDRLNVYVSWAGSGGTLQLKDVVAYEIGKGFDIRFSGNSGNMKEVPTGYLLTLESSPLSVTSNAGLGLTRYGYRERKFRVKRDILPENGTPVKVTFKLAK